jgi:hypothetical protein
VDADDLRRQRVRTPDQLDLSKRRRPLGPARAGQLRAAGPAARRVACRRRTRSEIRPPPATETRLGHPGSGLWGGICERRSTSRSPQGAEGPLSQRDATSRREPTECRSSGAVGPGGEYRQGRRLARARTRLTYIDRQRT